jgi:hypothetical protein
MDDGQLSKKTHMVKISWALAIDLGDKPKRSALPCPFEDPVYPLKDLIFLPALFQSGIFMDLTNNEDLVESLAPTALSFTGDQLPRPHVIVGSREGSQAPRRGWFRKLTWDRLGG